MENNTEYTIHI